jgi:hypothetical protein
MTTPAILPAGTTFANGVDGLHANGANWATELTIVRTDAQSYGQPRYIVADGNGRRFYAYRDRSY